MKDRLADFATDAPDDPFRLDANGYPFHQTNEDALTFLKESKDKPFFLYYATWLVHAPIHTRSEAHLKKYAERLGTDPAATPKKDTPGQLNPFYASMVQELDYYLGQVFDYLGSTEDPRWPGHTLNENTSRPTTAAWREAQRSVTPTITRWLAEKFRRWKVVRECH